MTTDTTGAALLAIVRANPADWDARRVYADWLDDGSEEGAIAANGQRWQAWKQRYPERCGHVRNGTYIIGVRWCGKRKASFVQSKLPKLILEEMGLIGRESVVGEIKFASADAAEAALARALWALGMQAQ